MKVFLDGSDYFRLSSKKSRNESDLNFAGWLDIVNFQFNALLLLSFCFYWRVAIFTFIQANRIRGAHSLFIADLRNESNELCSIYSSIRKSCSWSNAAFFHELPCLLPVHILVQMFTICRFPLFVTTIQLTIKTMSCFVELYAQFIVCSLFYISPLTFRISLRRLIARALLHCCGCIRVYCICTFHPSKFDLIVTICMRLIECEPAHIHLT